MKIGKHIKNENGRMIQTRILSNFHISELLEELAIMHKYKELTLEDCCRISDLAMILLPVRHPIRFVITLERRVEGYRPICYTLEVEIFQNTRQIVESVSFSHN